MSKPILLIDDEEKFAKMLHELLEINGYASDYCLNPKDALKLLKQEDYELVITDYKMPDMDGAEFLTEARKLNPDLPVIMVSGLMNMPELIKVANIGVTLALEKPFKTEELLESVGRFVKASSDTEEQPDNEASAIDELGMEADAVEVTYPSPSKFLADASNESKRFLEILWKQANRFRHLPFHAHRGAEVRLVAQEIMEWTDQDPDAEVVRIDFVDTKTDFTRCWVLECDPVPGVLMVDLREVAWDDDARKTLSEWICFIEDCGKDLSLCRILYVLPTAFPFSVDDLKLEDGMRDLIATEYPMLLSMRDRIADTAVYIKRMLSQRERSSLGESGLKRLLHYSWPGGYKELHSRISHIKSRLADGAAFDGESVGELLAEKTDDDECLAMSLDLGGFLKRRQRDYLLTYRQSGEPLTETLARIGVEDKIVDAEEILQAKVLLYEELVRGDNSR